MMVCQKVEEKGTTTYNEVADELVSKVVEERKKEQRELDDQRARTEETTTGTTTGSAHTTASKTPTTTTSKGKGRQGGKGKFDEKNIRRRVYDALNVLMAMEIITKKKKQITWNGLPTAAKQNLASMKQELHYRQQRLEYKRTSLRELLTQQVCFRNLVARNRAYAAKKEADRSGNGTTTETAEESTTSGSIDVTPEAPSAPPPSELEKIPLPFIVVNTNQSSVIQCDMSGDRTDVMFNFSLPFELNDDNTILKNMHMNRTSLSTVRQIVPPDLFEYCETNHLLDDVVVIPKDDDDTESLPLQQPRTGPSSSPPPTPPPCTRHQEQQEQDPKQSITPLSSTTTQHSDSATTTVLSPRSLQEEKAAASPDKSASSSTMSQHHTRDLVF